ncbi:hypothetical protein VTK73DRAFT_5092 [Phialemonium thermophilum]|uniref:Uncharacterized protein n=1 Tax=Phialemonium thermophilum TaxID=223376 RepID=A0ABR3V3Y0_9PEZI
MLRDGGAALDGLALEVGQIPLDLGKGERAQGARLLLAVVRGGVVQGVHADAQGHLGGELAGDLALVLAGGLADQRGVVDEAVLGGGVLGLEGAEQGLLGAQDLDGAAGVLGQVHQRAGVGDQAGADQVADQLGQVGGDGLHAVLQVAGQVVAVLGVLDDLLGEQLDVLEVLVGDLGAHADVGGGLDGGLDGLLQEGEVGGGGVGAHAHGQDDLGVQQVAREDLGQLGEVPAVPLAYAHGVGVELLVQVVEQGDGVHDHDVDLVGRELELVARQRVRQAQRHLLEVLGQHARDQVGEVGADGAEQVVGRRVGDGLDVEVGQLDDGVAQLLLGHGQGDLLLVLELVEQAG